MGFQLSLSAARSGPDRDVLFEKTLKLNGETLALKYYGAAHTDSDISVRLSSDADILHAGDTYWNGIYPFIDYSTGWKHRGDDQGRRGQYRRHDG